MNADHDIVRPAACSCILLQGRVSLNSNQAPLFRETRALAFGGEHSKFCTRVLLKLRSKGRHRNLFGELSPLVHRRCLPAWMPWRLRWQSAHGTGGSTLALWMWMWLVDMVLRKEQKYGVSCLFGGRASAGATQLSASKEDAMYCVKPCLRESTVKAALHGCKDGLVCQGMCGLLHYTE